MRTIISQMLVIAAVGAFSCSQSASNIVTGEYFRLDSNQFSKVTQVISIQPANSQSTQLYSIVIKSFTDYLDERTDQEKKRPYTGTYNVKEGIMTTNDPEIVITFDHRNKVVMINRLIYKKRN